MIAKVPEKKAPKVIWCVAPQGCPQLTQRSIIWGGGGLDDLWVPKPRQIELSTSLKRDNVPKTTVKQFSLGGIRQEESELALNSRVHCGHVNSWCVNGDQCVQDEQNSICFFW